MPTFSQAREGICMICTDQTTVVEVDFQDASKLKGPLCQKDFWKAVEKRAEKKPPEVKPSEEMPEGTQPQQPPRKKSG